MADGCADPGEPFRGAALRDAGHKPRQCGERVSPFGLASRMREAPASARAARPRGTKIIRSTAVIASEMTTIDAAARGEKSRSEPFFQCRMRNATR